MRLPEPKFTNIKNAAIRLNVAKADVVEYILGGHLSIYAYGTTIIRDDLGVEFKPEQLEPDRLTNPQKWNKDPYSNKAILVTYPTVVHDLYGDPNRVHIQPAKEHSIKIKDILILSAEVMAFKNCEPLRNEPLIDLGAVNAVPSETNLAETPEEYAERRRGEGAKKEIIAYELKYECRFELKGHRIAELVEPEKIYTTREYGEGDPRKRGWLLADRGKRMMAKMTSS